MARPEVRARCPHCGAERVTRAQRGVWIACLECGEQFRRSADAPEVSAPAAGEPAGPAAPAAPSPAPGGAAGSVTVERATPVVAQTARPRPRAGEVSPTTSSDASPPAGPEPSPGPATEASDPPALEQVLDYDREAARRPASQERARRAGRKGGLGFYKGMVG